VAAALHGFGTRESMKPDQHVDAVRAIYREYGRSHAKQLAAKLTKQLCKVTDEFLLNENRDHPEVLEHRRGALDYTQIEVAGNSVTLLPTAHRRKTGQPE
jgi:hypothetical protein